MMGKLAGLQQVVKRSSLFFVALCMLATWVLADAVLFISHVSAAAITSRSLHVTNSAVGTLTAGQNVTYSFTFTVPAAATTLQSMDFQFCGTPLPGTDCNLPTGQSVTGAAISGAPAGLTGWSLGTSGDAPTNSWANGTAGTGGRIRITRTNGTNVSSATTATIAFSGITNPTTANQEFFVRLVAYTDTAWTTSRDTGTVANSTATQIDVTAKVQEVLNFSVGVDGDEDGDVEDPTTTCDPLAGGGALDLGDNDGVLSFNQAYDAHSYFRVSTNSNNGTIIYYAGDTLKYGVSDSITEIGAAAVASVPGTEQFGLAIDSGDLTTFGYSLSELVPTAPYAAGNGLLTAGTTTFAFDDASLTTPIQIAAADDPITCETGSVRYLGNISTTTPPGIYTTSISYIATPTY